MSAAPKAVTLLGGHGTLAAAAAFQHTAKLNTRCAYASAIDPTIALLGRDRPITEVADAEIGPHRAITAGRFTHQPRQVVRVREAEEDMALVIRQPRVFTHAASVVAVSDA